MRKANNLPPSCAVITKSGNLNFLETSGPVQACNGTTLPLQICRTGCVCEIKTVWWSNGLVKMLMECVNRVILEKKNIF